MIFLFKKVKKLISRIPGLPFLYYKIFFPFYRNKVGYLKSKDFYPAMGPKSYSKENFYKQLKFARRAYSRWKMIERRTKVGKLMASYTHPYWQKIRSKIENYFIKNMDEGYLHNYLIQFNIGPDIAGVTPFGEFKLKCLLAKDDRVSKLLRCFKESRVGKPLLDPVRGIRNPVIISSSIDSFFYLSRIIRKLNSKFDSCVELGGGFGGFARIARLYNPKITFVIIDLPEILALQMFYHRLNFPNFPVVPHYQEKIKIKTGGLNLIPAWSIGGIKLHPDVFVSTYALTETTKRFREDIAKLNFFNTKTTYIVGGTDSLYKSHLHTQRLIKAKMKNVKIAPLQDDIYEILARR